jgi:multidrug efflux pump subunit AcrA (membrane-fusion protein)
VKQKTWVLAGAAILVAVAATGGGVVVSSAKGATQAAQEPPANTAKVEKGKLSAVISMDGTLTYRARSDGSPYAVINQARGTYTRLPDDGDKVECGDVLYRVDDHPVLLLCGTVPAYRDLHTGDVGEDVRQLNQNLSKLGYAAAAGVDIDPDDNAFTWKTGKALELLRHDKGVGVTGQRDAAVGDIVSTLSATGSVAAPAQARLNFKSGGLLAQLLANVGDRVAEGQPLARLDDTDLQVALSQAQASYNSAVAKLELTRAGSRPEDIAAAQAQVDQAKTKLAQAQAVPQSPDVQAAQAQLDGARSKLQQVLTGGSAGDVAAAQAHLDAATAKQQALTDPRPEDLAAAQSQVSQAQSKLQALLNPRPEEVTNAQAQLVSAQAKRQALTHPRPEDLAAAQSLVDQAKTRLAQLQDLPKTAPPQDTANAQLAVQSAQAGLERARAEATNVNLSKTASEADKQGAEATVRQAELAVVTAQNNLAKLQQQGPSDWDLRQAQEGVNSAQANLDTLRNPSPTDVQQAQAAVDQAQANLDKITKPSPYDVEQAQEAVNQAQTALDKLKNPSPADTAAAQQAVAQAQATLDKLTTPSDYDVQQAQQTVNQAQANLDKLLNNNKYDLQNAQAALSQAQANLGKVQNSTTPQDLAVAQAAVDQANAQLKQAQANLDAATLTAPFAGVVAATGVNPGEQLRASGEGAAVVTLVDTRQVRKDDAVFLPESVRIAQVSGELGGAAQPGAPVVHATSDTPEVQVDLEASQQGEVKEGDPARITLPGHKSVTGKVDRLGRVAQVPAGQSASARPQVGAATIPAYISLDDPVTARGLDKAPVRVDITTEGVESALSVPVTALVGKSGGGVAVEVVRAGGRRELVAVKPGLFDTAGGRVQVEGDLGEGDQVVVPSP